jgi:hypothetical protein
MNKSRVRQEAAAAGSAISAVYAAAVVTPAAVLAWHYESC